MFREWSDEELGEFVALPSVSLVIRSRMSIEECARRITPQFWPGMISGVEQAANGRTRFLREVRVPLLGTLKLMTTQWHEAPGVVRADSFCVGGRCNLSSRLEMSEVVGGILVQFTELSNARIKIGRKKVAKEHLLMLQTLQVEEEGEEEESSSEDELVDVSRNWREVSMAEVIAQLPIGPLTYKRKAYDRVFLASEGVESVIDTFKVSKVGACCIFARALDEGLIASVPPGKAFQDSALFFQILHSEEDEVSPISSSGMRVEVTKETQKCVCPQKEVRLYVLCVSFSQDEWVVCRRYTEFRKLHDCLYPGVPFPARSFGAKQVQERRKCFQRMMNDIVQDPRLVVDAEFLRFLDPLCSPALPTLLTMDPQIQSDMLFRSTEGFGRQWVACKGVLCDKSFFYYRTGDTASCAGELCLDYCKVDVIDSEKSGSFCITPLLEAQGRKVVFSCETEALRDQWITLLRGMRVDATLNRRRTTMTLSQQPDKPGTPMLRRYARGSVKLSWVVSVEQRLASVAGKHVFEGVPDSPMNIVLSKEEANKVEQGTLQKLVEKLTTPQFYSKSFAEDLLLTYRGFSTPRELMSLLVNRFYAAAPKDASKNSTQELVCVTLERWARVQLSDFLNDAKLTRQLLHFSYTALHEDIHYDVFARRLRKSLASVLDKQDVLREAAIAGAPEPLVPHLFDAATTSLLDVDPLELARQFCLIDKGLFDAIASEELLGQPWASKRKRELCPNVAKLIDRFNEVSNWVASVVLVEGVERRAALFTRMVTLASHLSDLNGFSALFAVLSGLSSNGLNRMAQTLAALTPKVVSQFEELKAILNPSKNNAVYRQRLALSNPPLLPYLGVYLADLTFIEDGNESMMQERINFSKCRMLARILRAVKEYQAVPYKLKPVPQLQQLLSRLSAMDEDEQYTLSLRLEPRK